jgi:Sec-independent protein translocase protein TatA
MFGISFAELTIFCLVALFLIKPKDLPEIAYFLGKTFYKFKKIYSDVKEYLKSSGKDLGLEEIKYEIDRGIADEKAKSNDDVTTIIDIYGNEHQVNKENISDNFSQDEITKLNSENDLKNHSKKKSKKS